MSRQEHDPLHNVFVGLNDGAVATWVRREIHNGVYSTTEFLSQYSSQYGHQTVCLRNPSAHSGIAPGWLIMSYLSTLHPSVQGVM